MRAGVKAPVGFELVEVDGRFALLLFLLLLIELAIFFNGCVTFMIRFGLLLSACDPFTGGTVCSLIAGDLEFNGCTVNSCEKPTIQCI